MEFGYKYSSIDISIIGWHINTCSDIYNTVTGKCILALSSSQWFWCPCKQIITLDSPKIGLGSNLQAEPIEIQNLSSTICNYATNDRVPPLVF